MVEITKMKMEEVRIKNQQALQNIINIPPPTNYIEKSEHIIDVAEIIKSIHQLKDWIVDQSFQSDRQPWGVYDDLTQEEKIKKKTYGEFQLVYNQIIDEAFKNFLLLIKYNKLTAFIKEQYGSNSNECAVFVSLDELMSKYLGFMDVFVEKTTDEIKYKYVSFREAYSNNNASGGRTTHTPNNNNNNNVSNSRATYYPNPFVSQPRPGNLKPCGCKAGKTQCGGGRCNCITNNTTCIPGCGCISCVNPFGQKPQ
jgi:hypothetical protein